MYQQDVRELFREWVRQVLAESYDDIVEVIVKIRIRVARKIDPTVLDIMTDVRGLPNVITVKQFGELGKLNTDGRQFAVLQINFVNNETYNVADLLTGLKSVNGVDLARLIAYEGKRVQGKEYVK